MTNYKDYEDIDVPSFMKNKTKPIATKEEQEKELEIAFIKGGLSAIGCMFTLIIMFTILALIEMI